MLVIEITCQVLAFLIGFFILRNYPILGVFLTILITLVLIFRVKVLEYLKYLFDRLQRRY
jgi:hypothetical protein